MNINARPVYTVTFTILSDDCELGARDFLDEILDNIVCASVIGHEINGPFDVILQERPTYTAEEVE